MYKINKKELNNLKEIPSATIKDNGDGTYGIDNADTSKIYLFVLRLIKEKIKKIDLNISNQHPNFFSFNTSDVTNIFIDISNNKLILSKNTKQGHCGNLSKSYYSIEKNTKIINNDMFNIINKVLVKILVLKNNEYYLIDIKNVEDFELFIKNIVTYKPIRLYLDNITKSDSEIFYLKPINAMIEKIYNDLIDGFNIDNNLVKMSGVEISKDFNIDIASYLTEVSNNNYFCKIENNIIVKIYLIEKYYLYLPYKSSSIHNYDEYSFIKNEFIFKQDNSELFEKIDILDLYSKKYNNANINKLTYFVRNISSMIDDKIKKSIEKTGEVILSETDIDLKRDLSNLKSNLFEISKGNNSNLIVRIKNKKESGILVKFYDRINNKYTNQDEQITYFSLIKDNLYIEREKAYSIFFIDKFIKELMKIGHTKIQIILERPISKKDGRRGYIDVVIISEYNNRIYGQVFEFKAIANYKGNVKIESEEQAESYNIEKIINKYNINESYKGCNFNIVKLENLIDKNKDLS